MSDGLRWHWDRVETDAASISYDSIVRWRCGWFLTVYRFEGRGQAEWRVYFPLNISFGIAIGASR